MSNLFEMMAEAARQAQQRQTPPSAQPQSLEDAWRQAQAEWARRAQAAAGQRPAQPGARPPPIPPRVPQARKPQPKRKAAAPPPIPRTTTPITRSAPVAAPPDAYAVSAAPTAAVTARPSAAARATRSSAPLLDGSSPRSLRAQFVLSEILRPPVSMREPR